MDRESRIVTVDGRAVGFDWPVLAAVATHAYFGHEVWAGRAPGLKTLEDALEIRRRILLAFEEAEMEDDPEVRKAKLSFAVVGGGTTGVELAGALREIAAKTLARDYKRVDISETRVVLLEGMNRLLYMKEERLLAANVIGAAGVKGASIAESLGFVSGFLAWILWSIVHLTLLVGFRNMLMVRMNWGWQWLNQTRGARLIPGGTQVKVEEPVEL